MRRIPVFAVMALGLWAAPYALGQQFMRGKVIMPDASAPPQKVLIERVCPASIPMREAVTNRQGEFLWRSDSYGDVKRLGSLSDLGRMRCGLRARIPGFESDRIDIHDPRVLRNIQLPTMVLRPASSGGEVAGPVLPRAAVKHWDLAIKASDARQWPVAERWLREVTRTAPAFGPAWGALGYAYHNQNKTAEARDALQRAVAADPASLPARLQLLRLEMASQLWADAAKTAGALIQADDAHRYPEAHLQLAIARYQLHDLAAARAGLLETIRLDTRRELPQAEYLVGALLMEQGDTEGAAAHLRTYLERAPSAADAATVRAAIESLSHPGSPPPPSLPVAGSLPASAVEPVIATSGEAWVPGGRKALAAMAHIDGTPSAVSFFLEYCRAVALQTSPLTPNPVAGYAAALEAYLANIAILMDLGERREEGTRITLSLAAGEARQRTARILQLLGWKVTSGNGTASIELGDQPADWPRQQILPALGVDELAMQQALGAGRSFQFEIVSENADLAGGAAWGALTKEFSALPGGMAEGFVRQVHLSRAYAGLGNMGSETAMALARRMGLATLATVYADALWMNGEAFRVAGGRAAVPGGAAAEEVWTKLAGANPLDPVRFFEAVLKSARGRLAGFYAAVARGDAAHQKFFTKDLARAQRYYAWYREAEETRVALGNPALAWRALVFQNLPLNDAGDVAYPGGRAAWSPAASDDDALVPAQSIGGARIVQPAPAVDMEALMAVARLERERARPLDAESAKLLARNFAAWRSLFPYFVALPGLGVAEFQALADFSVAVSGYSAPAQDLALGEWHSLVALIVLGGKAGSLDDGAAAHAFERVCRAAARQDQAAEALATLREISGGGPDLEEPVTHGLLRLNAARRADFARIRDLQNAPRLDGLSASSDAATLVSALSGAVYAATLDADGLLVNEDRGLLGKHVWRGGERQSPLFSASSLVASNTSTGSHLAGGFANFEEVARRLARVPVELPAVADPGKATGGALPETVFRAYARLVEVPTTVTDDRGRYVDNLAAEQFTIRQGGQPMSIAAFEKSTAAISCALLLDTSHSMQTALPALKSAALQLIAALRDKDSVAVYSLSGGISELQPFTTDKTAATRAVLGAALGGETALYDALVRVNRELAGRRGKKVIVVFTDGEDNMSTLAAETAILRARTAGVPIHTIAQGIALQNSRLLKELSDMSQATGGLAFTIQTADAIHDVFERVLEDLLHGYLLLFQPPPAEDHAWRRIEVGLRDRGTRKVRAREGYFPE